MTKKRRALLVANYKFSDPNIQPLAAPLHEVKALREILEDPEIGNFEVEELIDGTSYDVTAAVNKFFSPSDSIDALRLLYLAGHGIKDKNGNLYFATKDTLGKDWLISTAVSRGDICNSMKISRSRQKVLILDCCYSGDFIEGMTERGDSAVGIGGMFSGEGCVVLTASDSLQCAFEEKAAGGKTSRSIYTGQIIEGLKSGEADYDGDGKVSLLDLSDYLRKKVPEKLPQMSPQSWNLSESNKSIIIATSPGIGIVPAPDKRLCPYCGEPLRSNSIFCSNCGNNVIGRKSHRTGQMKCPACSSESRSSAIFCPICGKKL